jgi:hypothetical protein
MKKILLCVLLLVVVVALSSSVFAEYKSETIDGNDTWTDPIAVQIGCGAHVSIKPDTSPIMVVELQCKLRGDSSWGRMIERWTLTAASSDIECITKVEQEDGVQYRIGCKTGDYTSGNCTARIGTGRQR